MDSFSGKMMKGAQSRANELANLMVKWELDAEDIVQITQGGEMKWGHLSGNKDAGKVEAYSTPLTQLEEFFNARSNQDAPPSRQELAQSIASDLFVKSFAVNPDYWHDLLEDLNDIAKAFNAYDTAGQEDVGITAGDTQANWLRRDNDALQGYSPLHLLRQGSTGAAYVADFLSTPHEFKDVAPENKITGLTPK